jgi:hypothetical protein
LKKGGFFVIFKAFGFEWYQLFLFERKNVPFYRFVTSSENSKERASPRRDFHSYLAKIRRNHEA